MYIYININININIYIIIYMLHGVYIPYAQCMEYLPILIQTMTPMLANIPYMEHMGIYCGV